MGCEDIRVIYTFGGEKASELANMYEAHSDNDVSTSGILKSTLISLFFLNNCFYVFMQVLVLVNITPDQSMMDEGVSREVINRIQKLRKKAHLVPSDEVSVFYSVTPQKEYLHQVVLTHTKYIESTLKAPLLPLPHPGQVEVIIEETQKVSPLFLATLKTRFDLTIPFHPKFFIFLSVEGSRNKFGDRQR